MSCFLCPWLSHRLVSVHFDTLTRGPPPCWGGGGHSDAKKGIANDITMTDILQDLQFRVDTQNGVQSL